MLYNMYIRNCTIPGRSVKRIYRAWYTRGMANDPQATPRKPPNTHRDKQLNVRIDRDLYDAAMDRSGDFGLGVVVRALLRAYVAGEVELPEIDLVQEATPAPRLKHRTTRAHKPRQGAGR